MTRSAVARTTIPPLSLAEAFRREAHGLDRELPVFDVTALEDRVNQNQLNALRAALVGVAPGDPLSLAGAALALILAGLLGCAIPARRAIRVDPIVALRCD